MFKINGVLYYIRQHFSIARYIAFISATHCLANSPGFTFRLEQNEDISLSDRALNVTNNGAATVVQEFNLDLCDTTSGSGLSECLSNLGELDGCLNIGLER